MSLEPLLVPESPVLEFVLRGAVIYFALMAALRLIGTHEFGQLSPFDLILLPIIPESISTALNAYDRSITTDLVVAATLFAVNYLMSLAGFRFPGFKRLVAGEAQEPIREGSPNPQVVRRERMTMDDIKSSLREKGIDSIERVRLGYLENDGEISAPNRGPRRTDRDGAVSHEEESDRLRNVGSVRFELTIDGSLRCASVLQRVITIQ